MKNIKKLLYCQVGVNILGMPIYIEHHRQDIHIKKTFTTKLKTLLIFRQKLVTQH